MDTGKIMAVALCVVSLAACVADVYAVFLDADEYKAKHLALKWIFVANEWLLYLYIGATLYMCSKM